MARTFASLQAGTLLRLLSDLASRCGPLSTDQPKKIRLLSDLAARCQPLPVIADRCRLIGPQKTRLVSDLAEHCRLLPTVAG